jgi:hypothetical protein
MDVVNGPHLLGFHPSPVKPEHKWLSDDYESQHPLLLDRYRVLDEYSKHINDLLASDGDHPIPHVLVEPFNLHAPAYKEMMNKYGPNEAMDKYMTQMLKRS